VAKVHLTPWWWVAGGIGLLAVVHLAVGLSVGGWVAGLVYLVASSALLSLGLVRRETKRFGAANAVTATRSVLVGVVTALTATSFTQPVAAGLVVAIVVVALLLDGVDGWTARRTHSESPLGARFDMEVDAFLLLALGVFDVRVLGWWVLAIGLMRYVYVAVGWALPWLRAKVPFRYWRKVVTAVCGIALTLAATGLAPTPIAIAGVAIALALLVESFGRDVIWLAERRVVT
jgi:phosphatidylglycerophosphate synthase